MRSESSDPMDNVANLRSVLIQKDRDLTSLKQELERSKKDKATTNSLVTTLQRDMSNRDNTICRIRGELEIVKRELRGEGGIIVSNDSKGKTEIYILFNGSWIALVDYFRPLITLITEFQLLK